MWGQTTTCLSLWFRPNEMSASDGARKRRKKPLVLSVVAALGPVGSALTSDADADKGDGNSPFGESVARISENGKFPDKCSRDHG